MEFVRFLHVLLGAIWMGGAMYGESLVALSRNKGRDEYVKTNVKVHVLIGCPFLSLGWSRSVASGGVPVVT